MHFQYPTYYEVEKHHREAELQRKLEQNYWVEQAQLPNKKRPRRWRAFISMVIGFFL